MQNLHKRITRPRPRRALGWREHSTMIFENQKPVEIQFRFRQRDQNGKQNRFFLNYKKNIYVTA